jgi:hypothetical protein
MKLLNFDNVKTNCSKGLFAILLLTGLFIFSHQAASSQIRNAPHTTEYVQADTRLIKGLKYQALSCRDRERATTGILLFRKTNLSCVHSKNASTQLKLTVQTVLNKTICSLFCFVKSIPQSGKDDTSAILS